MATAVIAAKPEVSTLNTFRKSHRQYRELVMMLTWRDIKVRYKQSVMGFLWAVLMPVLIISSGFVVMIAFSTMSGRSAGKADLLSIAVKAVPWAFVVGAIRFATNSFLQNKELVTKVFFPREILPLASVLASLFDFAVAGAVLAIVLFACRVGVSPYLAWTPLLLLILVVLTAALSLLLACANLFFRDVKYLVEVGLTYGIFFTPVFYSANKLGKWRDLLLLNPLAPVFDGLANAVVLHRPPDPNWTLYSAVFAFATLCCSWAIFRAAESKFAESI